MNQSRSKGTEVARMRLGKAVRSGREKAKRRKRKRVREARRRRRWGVPERSL